MSAIASIPGLPRPVKAAGLAYLAAAWSVAQCLVLIVVAASQLAALWLLRGADYFRAFHAQRLLQTMVDLLLRVQAAGYRIELVLFGVAAATLAYLWLRSRR